MDPETSVTSAHAHAHSDGATTGIEAKVGVSERSAARRRVESRGTEIVLDKATNAFAMILYKARGCTSQEIKNSNAVLQ